MKPSIQTLECILRGFIIYFKGSWDSHLPLVEFAYNNNFHSFISMDPYKALYCSGVGLLFDGVEVGGPSLLCPELIYMNLEKVHIIRNRLRTTYSRQNSYADNRRRGL